MNRKAAYLLFIDLGLLFLLGFYASGHKLARKEKERDCLKNEFSNNGADNYSSRTEKDIF